MKLVAFLLLAASPSLSVTGYQTPKHGCATEPPDDMAMARGATIRSPIARFYRDDNMVSRNSCPSEMPICYSKGYLIKNDKVLAYNAFNNFVCVAYLNRRTESSGWIKAKDLVFASVQLRPSENEWLGTWQKQQSKVIISRDKSGHLEISGGATGGFSGDNMADFIAQARRSGDRIYFTADQEDSSNFTARLIGNFLIISDDEREIGGKGVLFGGRYIRTVD